MPKIISILHDASTLDDTYAIDRGELDHLIALQDEIQARFGLDFLDEWDAAWTARHSAEVDRAYEQGFLTAFRLWMEVFSPDVLR